MNLFAAFLVFALVLPRPVKATTLSEVEFQRLAFAKSLPLLLFLPGASGKKTPPAGPNLYACYLDWTNYDYCRERSIIGEASVNFCPPKVNASFIDAECDLSSEKVYSFEDPSPKAMEFEVRNGGEIRKVRFTYKQEVVTEKIFTDGPIAQGKLNWRPGKTALSAKFLNGELLGADGNSLARFAITYQIQPPAANAWASFGPHQGSISATFPGGHRANESFEVAGKKNSK